MDCAMPAAMSKYKPTAATTMNFEASRIASGESPQQNSRRNLRPTSAKVQQGPSVCYQRHLDVHISVAILVLNVVHEFPGLEADEKHECQCDPGDGQSADEVVRTSALPRRASVQHARARGRNCGGGEKGIFTMRPRHLAPSLHERAAQLLVQPAQLRGLRRQLHAVGAQPVVLLLQRIARGAGLRGLLQQSRVRPPQGGNLSLQAFVGPVHPLALQPCGTQGVCHLQRIGCQRRRLGEV
mmetsp:Transcript_155837/g.499628  ORF Transcript_155837/g.499628 Transcript_155837/m.499628 type:complete len:240 (+) Transcript_155837:158-877(+)